MTSGVEMLASPDEGFFAYYKPHCATSFNQALNDLQRYMETEGHFDGLVAFSQGTSLAMALLVGSPECLSHIRCAIFFSGRRPFVDCGTIPSVTSQVNAQEKMIRIPTAHIWGREDRVEPGESLALSELCPPQHRMIYVHAGGHEVPGPKDREGLVESVNIVRKLLVLANVEMPSQGRAWE
jgi:pimeloyl-ACP methyl ester carboxylesterase